MTTMFGRDRELATVESWLETDAGGALLIEGEAGIGKTTLWGAAAEAAERRGDLVLSCSPVETETRLAFAALADLLAPVLGEALAGAPPPQRRALEAALLVGEQANAPADERAVAFAVLTVLRHAASTRRLVVAVDDTQWLDPSSAVTLGYALRRAGQARVKALLARRTLTGGPDDQLVAGVSPGQVQRIVLRGLSLGALHRLIRQELGTALTRPVLVRIHESSGGSPLHAIELARVAADDGVSGSGTLGSLLEARAAALPDRTRRAITIAALAFHPTISLLDDLLDGGADDALGPASEAGLIDVRGGQVRFRHPLVAAVVRRAAPDGEARELHRRLATRSDSLEERAVHLWLAADGPEGSVADLLDEAADAARSRGALATVADLLELAARATPPDDAERGAERLVASAHAAFASGDSGRARTLLEAAAAHDGPARFRALWLLGLLLDEAVGGEAALGPLREALGTDDPALAAAVHRTLAQTLLYTDPGPATAEHADAAVAAARAAASPVELAYSLAAQTLVRFFSGHRDWRGSLNEALAIEARHELPELDLCPTAVAADTDRLRLRLAEARGRYEELRRVAADRQDARTEVWALYGLAHVELAEGRLAAAGRLSGELLDLSEQTELFRLPALRTAALQAGLSGDVERARAFLRCAIEEAEAAGEPLNLRNALTTSGHLDLSGGDGAAAAAAFRRASVVAGRESLGGPLLALALLDEVEALSLAGEPSEARDALGALLDTAAGGDEPWLDVATLRGRAHVLAAEGALDEAIDLLREATAREEAVPVPLERARAWLALGLVLRRARRRAEARAALGTARSRFEELGMPIWAARAEAELSRIGGRRRADGLTPTETRVAELAATGLSNKEVGAALYVSVKTVEATLSRIYAKLGVRNRAALAAALAGQSRGESPLSRAGEGA
jgi:DNA-binding CsgD family transcriptional regulator